MLRRDGNTAAAARGGRDRDLVTLREGLRAAMVIGVRTRAMGMAGVSVDGCLHVSSYVGDTTRQQPGIARLARVYLRFNCRH